MKPPEAARKARAHRRLSARCCFRSGYALTPAQGMNGYPCKSDFDDTDNPLVLFGAWDRTENEPRPPKKMSQNTKRADD